jgi:hypothetical protein
MTRYSLDWRANWLIIAGGKSGAGGRGTSCAPACMAMGAHREKPDLVLGNCVRRSDRCVHYGSNARRGRSKLDQPIVQGRKPAL